MSDPGRMQQPPFGTMRLAGMGMELAGAVLAFVLIGYWIDRLFESGPWGVLICACLGVVGGLYNLIRVAVLDAVSPQDRRGRRGRQAEEDLRKKAEE